MRVVVDGGFAMKARTLGLAIAAACLLGSAGYGLYRAGVSDGKELAVSANAVPGRKVLYWHDPMVPGHKFDKPGPSPFMDMQLVPVYADSESDANTVRISPRTQQNLGMRTAQVTLGTVKQTKETGGSVAPEKQSLLVPSEAVIRTGTRNVVIVSEGGGHFHPQEVQVGRESGDQTEILAGVSAGERVVTSGQFLIDSEASLKGVTVRAIPGDKP
jgi:hypothetical protein